MDKSRTYNVKRNLRFGLFNKIVTLILPFLLRTMIIYKLGAEYLGLNSLFASILQVLNMTELGFSSAISFRMYKPIAENNTDEVCSLMAFYRFVYKIIGSVILVIGICIMPLLPYLINGTYPNEINIYVVYLIYLINTAISYLFFAYKSTVLSVSQRQDVVDNVDTVIVFVRCFFQIIAIINKNYYAYIIINIISTLLKNIIIALVSKKIFPDYVCRGSLPKEEIKHIATQIKYLTIGKISYVSRNSFDNIILSFFCGLVSVAIYSNYYYVISALLGILTVIIQAMTASVGNSMATETKEKNYLDFIKFNFYYNWIGGWCTITLLCLYQPFMKLWAGKELMVPFETVILFCLYFYVAQMGQVRAVYATVSGIWWEFRYLYIGEMVGNIVLNFGLGYFLGMNGIILATIINIFLFSIIGNGIKTINICFGKSVREYFIESLIYGMITLGTAIVTYFICTFIQGSEVILLVKRGIVCSVLPNIIFFIILLLRKKYRTYMLQIKEIINIDK